MAFYFKKLRNTNELHKEQARLRKQLELLKKDDPLFFPVKPTDEKSEDQGLLSVLSGGAVPLISTLISLISNRLKKSETKTHNRKADNDLTDNWLVALIVEFGGGYIKWKAIDLTAKAVYRMVRQSRKEKQES